MKKAADDLELLLIEDNPADVYIIKEMLRSSSLHIKNVYETDRINTANEILKGKNIHVTLLDLSLPDSFGINSFLGIKEAAKKVPIIILTGFSDTGTALQAIKEGAQDYLIKSEMNETLLSRAIMYSMERQKQEEKLIASEEKYRQIVETAQDGIWMIDENNNVTFVNKKMGEMLGYSVEEIMGRSIFDFMIESEKEYAAKEIEQQKKEDGGSREFRFIAKGGKEIWTNVSSNPIFDNDGKYKGALAMVSDISLRKRLQNELNEQRRLKQLQITAAVLEAQEKERTAIGEELHDNINQILSSVKMYIAMATKKPEKLDELLLKCTTYISMAIEENRKLARELILPQLKGVGFSEALKELAEEIKLTSKFSIILEIKEFDETIFNEQQKVSLYRIVQEQMHNIIKHADAKLVSIQLYKENNKIVLIVSDDGKGFDISVRSKGVGLTNIESRAEALNGRLEIDSAPGKGCCMKVIIDRE